MKLIKPSQYNIITAKGDALKFFETISYYGANSTRIFLLHTWGKPTLNPLQPFKQVGTWDAGYEQRPILPVFTCTQKNPLWWQNLSIILGYVKKYLKSAHLVFEDFCSIKIYARYPGYVKYYNPFHSNIQRWPNWAEGRHGDPAIPGGYWGEGMKVHHVNFWEDVLILCVEKGIEELDLEYMNEADCVEQPDQFFLDYHNWAVRTLRDLAKAHKIKARIIASVGRIPEKIFDPGNLDDPDVFSQHGIGSADMILSSYYGLSKSRVELSGDGACGGKGNLDYKGRRCASADQMRDIARKMNELGYPSWEYFDFGIEGPSTVSTGVYGDVVSDSDLFDPKPLEAFTTEFIKWTPPTPPEPEYVFVGICDETKKVANNWCPNAQSEKFIKGQEPTEYCDIHKEPEPVYIEVPVCKESSLRPNQYCPKATQIFIEGEEPAETCDIHKAPEKPKSCWDKYMADRPIKKWQLGKFLKCLFSGE